jgi:starch-binding outer membrane protein, SusD/RagB family
MKINTISIRLYRKIENSLLEVVIIAFVLIHVSCKKLVEIPPPPASIAENSAYTIDAAAISVLTGIYKSMSTSGSFAGSGSITLFSSLSADELILYDGVTVSSYQAYFQNALSAIVAPVGGSEQWAPLYNYVFRCNAAIEGLTSSKATGLTPSIRQQLLGEAKFMRAFFYFYLLNLFGDVPLALTTDPKVNTLLPRAFKVDVYKQIQADLKEAQQLLSDDYLKETILSKTTERVRPTKWAATALLARVYLYTGDYANAEAQATTVISNTGLYNLVLLNDVFIKNSREAIWQIQPTTTNFNTEEALTFIIPSTGFSTAGKNSVYLSTNLLDSFETGDLRAKYKNWIDTITISGTLYRYPYKYKVNALNPNIDITTGSQFMTEYLMVLRLGEQFLIRAEARAKQSNLDGARLDLNIIRNRAGLNNITVNDKNALLSAINHERQVELFTEFGHRWFDLKRTGTIDAIMSIITPQKANGVPWQSFQQLYPLPQGDMDKAPNLVQNSGY